MTAYGFIMCAYVFDLLDIGLVGKRGRVILVLVAVALADAWWVGVAGWIGVAAGVGSVAGIRRLGEWLKNEDGLYVVGVFLVEVAEGTARYAGDCVRIICAVFTPPRTDDARGPVLDAQPVEAGPVRTSPAVGTGWQRWTTSGPGDVPEAVRELNAKMGYATRAPEIEPAAPEGLHSVETYSDWLPTAVDTCGGANAAAREAKRRFDVSRTKFYDDMRALRQQAA